ncbi:MAG: hypothetical protein MAG715_01282 [Methanonatronarchaeales archaeon]|nr:hypothetical protein [Methanonatronarchaeales archaeon]
MPERLKKLIRSVSDTERPVEILLENCYVTLEGRPVLVDGALSISPPDGDDESFVTSEDLKLERGDVRLNYSERETCLLKVEGDSLVMDVRKGSLFRDFVKSLGSGGGTLTSLKERGLSLDLKYKGMTLLRNADPESLKSFLKKL